MIYLDNAATTRICGEALEEMLPYLRESYGNPSAVYSLGSWAKKGIAESRRRIAGTLGALPEEIYFTSGGSEADTWALRAVTKAEAAKGKHIITTGVEHHAVLHTCRELEREGFRVTYLSVDEYGRVDPRQVEAAIRPDTILVSVMFANNEVGTIQPVEEIGKIARSHGILFHTDAVQAYGHLPISVDEMKIDLLSASGHKFHGPKGVGFLYVRKGLALTPLIYGGAQERGMRAGTENVAGIVGMGRAALAAGEELTRAELKLRELSGHLTTRLLTEIPGCILNGHPRERLPGNVSVCIPPVEGESVLIQLDMQGICASSGSACTMGSREPSHVLTAMGRTGELAKGSLRFTMSRENTMEEMDRVADALKEIVGNMRKMMGWKAQNEPLTEAEKEMDRE